MSERTMTVRELIHLLREYDESLPVKVCDPSNAEDYTIESVSEQVTFTYRDGSKDEVVQLNIIMPY